jgi:hypothetical protein
MQRLSTGGAEVVQAQVQRWCRHRCRGGAEVVQRLNRRGARWSRGYAGAGSCASAGTEVQRYRGTEVQWYNGTQVQRHRGLEAQRYRGGTEVVQRGLCRVVFQRCFRGVADVVEVQVQVLLQGYRGSGVQVQGCRGAVVV